MRFKTARPWPVRDGPPTLEMGDVHLWAVPLDLEPEAQAALVRFLADDERARSRRYVSAVVGARFAVGRGVLRALLGAYAQMPPAELVLAAGVRGKPMLVGPGPEWLRFNMAHSHTLALVAVARDVDVGIDVEHRRAVPAAETLAARYLHADDARALAALPPSERSDAFLRRWARAEATLKATGEGLAGPLALDDRFLVHDLAPRADYVGAVAIPPPARRLRCFTLRTTSPLLS